MLLHLRSNLATLLSPVFTCSLWIPESYHSAMHSYTRRGGLKSFLAVYFSSSFALDTVHQAH